MLALTAGRNGPAKALHALAHRLRDPYLAPAHDLATQIMSELQVLETQIDHESLP
jgi:hypothetical protein